MIQEISILLLLTEGLELELRFSLYIYENYYPFFLKKKEFKIDHFYVLNIKVADLTVFIPGNFQSI